MPTDIDWAAKRNAWLKAVNSLFDTIQNSYLKNMDVEIERPKKKVWEHDVGDYEISELSLRVGDEQVLFSPKGLIVVGSKGRVDVFGDRGEATLVLQPDNRWHVVTSRVPTRQLEPLNANTFAEMLAGIMRP